MKLVAVSKLVVSREQGNALLATTARVNAARSWLASQAMALPRCDRKSKYALQRLFYAEMRERFGISAQMTVRAIATVAACFKTDPYAEHKFREKAAISYDARILSFGGEGVPTSVSIATLDGRIHAYPVATPVSAGSCRCGCAADSRFCFCVIRASLA